MMTLWLMRSLSGYKRLGAPNAAVGPARALNSGSCLLFCLSFGVSSVRF